jgi:hypothetical protein
VPNGCKFGAPDLLNDAAVVVPHRDRLGDRADAAVWSPFRPAQQVAEFLMIASVGLMIVGVARPRNERCGDRGGQFLA